MPPKAKGKATAGAAAALTSVLGVEKFTRIKHGGLQHEADVKRSFSVPGRANSTKTESATKKNTERPTDPARCGKEGSKDGIKEEPNAQALCQKKLDFFQTTGRHPPGARRETTEVKTRKS